MMNTDFKGAARRLDDIDIPKIGMDIGCGEDEIHAVIDVEAAGTGFDSKGRPKMLFEPHVFFRNLSGTKRVDAVHAGLAYPKWGEKPYPKDSYPRLIAAMKINEDAALKSCSWGMGQVLGENFGVCGYYTIQAFVRAMMEDEENHLRAMVEFIKGNHLDDELRGHKWAAFARGYNGPGYAKNKYDIKLAKAYAWWRGKPDTPIPATVPPSKPVPTAAAVGGAVVIGGIVAHFWGTIVHFIQGIF